MPAATETVLGYPIVAQPLDACIHDIRQHISQGKPAAYLACLNTYSFVTSQKDDTFATSLHASRWLVPDGAGILLASKLLAGQLSQRITGDDIFRNLCQTLPAGTRVFFLGSTPETLRKIKAKFTKDFPTLTLAGTLSPPFKPVFSEADNARMIKAINQSRASVLWVGLTAPKQEKWLHTHINALDIHFAAGIGAVFDFYAGNSRRAPRWMQQNGLEWLYRLSCNPRKLARRYLSSNPVFLAILAKEYLKRTPR